MSRQASVFLITVFILVGVGIVMTYSASAIYAEHVYKNAEHFLVRQIVYAVLGSLVLIAAAVVPIAFWQKHSRLVMLLAIFLLGIVYLPFIGHSAGGAQRWINLGIINFQPAEFAKVAVIVYLADYLTRKRNVIKKGGIGVFIPPLILIGCAGSLTLLQPDLGSTAFIFLIVASMFFLAGFRIRYVAIGLAIVVPIFYLLVVHAPYRMSRITAYINPWDDPQGNGFQIIQSFIAFGLGGIKGAGLGQGIQKLFYLPSSYNDFIFSIIGEELGLIGLLTIILLYVILFVCGIQIAEKAHRDYEKFLITAITLSITLQAIIHMLVTTGLVPTKGLPLPFVSFGGTALLFHMMSVGLLVAADRHLQGGR